MRGRKLVLLFVHRQQKRRTSDSIGFLFFTEERNNLSFARAFGDRVGRWTRARSYTDIDCVVRVDRNLEMRIAGLVVVAEFCD